MMGKLFSGSSTLTRFIFRRDRLSLVIWNLAIVVLVVAMVPVIKNMFSDGEAETMVMAEMMKNPAMIAIVGPVYGGDNYTTGPAFANMMLLFTALIVGVMNIFFVARHTRQDEEAGRLEVIRSLPVGRLSNLAAVMIAALIVNTFLGVVTGLGLALVAEEGMCVYGCLLFGAVMGVTGLFFAAVTAVFCQLTANNRTALSLSFLAMIVLYLLRAIGDIGTEILSLLSPLGLILRTEVFVGNYVWPIFIVLAISVLFVFLAFVLARIRDLGRGLLPEKRGKSHGGRLLSSPLGLSLRLQKTSIIVWTLTIFILAAMYGSVFGDLEGFINSSDLLKAIFTGTSNYSYVEQFISFLMIIMTIIATIPTMMMVNRGASEEKLGHAEQIFARAVSRHEQLAAYLVPALVLAVILQVMVALGFWSVGSMVLESAPSLQTFMISALSYLPGVFVMLAISALLTAIHPSLSSLSYLYLGYAFLADYLGAVAKFPDWMKKATPFGYIAKYPIEDLDWLPLMVMMALSVILIAAGFVIYRQRGIKTR